MTRRRRLHERVLEFARTRRLFDAGDHVLVAVSGGPDSLVMLDLLHQIRDAFGVRLSVAHVDHGIRHDSAADADFVREHAARLQLPFYLRNIHCPSLALQGHRGIEEVAREQRYQLLHAMAIEAKARVIVTGHTATDQAETLLMRLIRGTGPLGLSGIAARRADAIVRPLLCLTRQEVRSYAGRHRIQCLQDPTNRDPGPLRNRVRLRVLPLLRRLNPRVDFLLSDLAEDMTALGDMVRAHAREGLVHDVDGIRIPLAQMDDWLAYRVLAAFEQLTAAPLGLSRTHVDAVASLRETGKRVALPRGVKATRDREGIVVSRKVPCPSKGS